MNGSPVDTACDWLRGCLDQHRSCQEKAQVASVWANGRIHIARDVGHDDRMPRRLLDLGSDIHDVKVVKIEKTTQDFRCFRHFTLSHQWGLHETFELTRSSSTINQILEHRIPG